jgi:hypothetical protein
MDSKGYAVNLLQGGWTFDLDRAITNLGNAVALGNALAAGAAYEAIASLWRDHTASVMSERTYNRIGVRFKDEFTGGPDDKLSRANTKLSIAKNALESIPKKGGAFGRQDEPGRKALEALAQMREIDDADERREQYGHSLGGL